jgi:hypothetical protein
LLIRIRLPTRTNYPGWIVIAFFQEDAHLHVLQGCNRCLLVSISSSRMILIFYLPDQE